MQRVRVLLCLLCFVINYWQGHAQTALKECLDSFLNVMSANDLFTGSILIAEHGKVIYTKSSGYWNAERKIPNSDTTPFQLASMSKPLTALAALQLVQKGKLQLDAPVARYLPDFPYINVTVRHLLTHISGLPQKFEQDYIREHPQAILTNNDDYSLLIASGASLVSSPGEKWAYSNAGYMVLAQIIEKISDMPFGTYMKKRVFEPAGMTHTYVRSAHSPNTPRYIIPLMYQSEYRHVDSLDHTKIYTNYNLGGIHGQSNVISTLVDMWKFDKALFSGKLISKELMEQAITPVVTNSGKVLYLKKSRSYGFGWNILQDSAGADKIVFHDGHVIGIVTMFYKNLTKDQTILFYDNRESPAFFEKIGVVAKLLNNEPVRNIKPAKSLARIYGQTLVTKGIDAATTLFNELKDDSVHYYVEELELNRLGYDLLGDNYPQEDYKMLALEVFKLNTLLFHSANSYDSYADALKANGKREEAIRMYQKSITLNPRNTEGKEKLAALQKRF
jgi:CubicO group peptidase (beta-lactamase class C family)